MVGECGVEGWWSVVTSLVLEGVLGEGLGQ